MRTATTGRSKHRQKNKELGTIVFCRWYQARPRLVFGRLYWHRNEHSDQMFLTLYNRPTHARLTTSFTSSFVSVREGTILKWGRSRVESNFHITNPLNNGYLSIMDFVKRRFICYYYAKVRTWNFIRRWRFDGTNLSIFHYPIRRISGHAPGGLDQTKAPPIFNCSVSQNPWSTDSIGFRLFSLLSYEQFQPRTPLIDFIYISPLQEDQWLQGP